MYKTWAIFSGDKILAIFWSESEARKHKLWQSAFTHLRRRFFNPPKWRKL